MLLHLLELMRWDSPITFFEGCVISKLNGLFHHGCLSQIEIIQHEKNLNPVISSLTSYCSFSYQVVMSLRSSFANNLFSCPCVRTGLAVCFDWDVLVSSASLAGSAAESVLPSAFVSMIFRASICGTTLAIGNLATTVFVLRIIPLLEKFLTSLSLYWNLVLNRNIWRQLQQMVNIYNREILSNPFTIGNPCTCRIWNGGISKG